MPQKIDTFRLSVLQLIVLVMFVLPVRADVNLPPTFAEAEALYTQGKFTQAANMARDLDSAPGLALAARSLLAYATTTAPIEEKLGLIDRAEDYARQALMLDDTVVEGHLQLVVALGHRAKAQGAMLSQLEGLAGTTRTHIDRALELEPDNPWALAISGGWHMELARRDPIGITVLIFGARRSTGMAEFERALEADPTNAVLHTQYGLTLLEIKRRKYRDRALTALAAADALAPPAAYDRMIQARGRHVFDLAKSEDKKALNLAVRNYNSLNTDNIIPPERFAP